MKKRILPLLAALVLSTLPGGCGAAPDAAAVAPWEPAGEGREVVDLLETGDQQLYLFTYSAGADYTRVDIWVELYEDGVYVEKPVMLVAADEAALTEGRIAVVIRQEPQWHWGLALQYGDAGTGHSGVSETYEYFPGGAFSCVSGAMDGPVEIADGEEIVLYASVSSDREGDMASPGDLQEYIRRPEQLLGYPYAQLVKCRFSK